MDTSPGVHSRIYIWGGGLPLTVAPDRAGMSPPLWAHEQLAPQCPAHCRPAVRLGLPRPARCAPLGFEVGNALGAATPGRGKPQEGSEPDTGVRAAHGAHRGSGTLGSGGMRPTSHRGHAGTPHIGEGSGDRLGA